MPAASGWDIVYNQAIIATTAAPNGWSVSLDGTSGAYNFTVGAPAGATIATGYEVRYATGNDWYEHFAHSALFDVVAPGTVRK